MLCCIISGVRVMARLERSPWIDGECGIVQEIYSIAGRFRAENLGLN